ncbi:hypothetical protein HDU99_008726, partial [Rhizoclosmatium hyalinum]
MTLFDNDPLFMQILQSTNELDMLGFCGYCQQEQDSNTLINGSIGIVPTVLIQATTAKPINVFLPGDVVQDIPEGYGFGGPSTVLSAPEGLKPISHPLLQPVPSSVCSYPFCNSSTDALFELDDLLSATAPSLDD